MSWLSRIFKPKSSSHELDDPILSQCGKIARTYRIDLSDNESGYIMEYRELVASSALGGSYVHPGVMHALSFVGLHQSLLKADIEAFEKEQFQMAIASLRKAKTLLPWPTILYALGLAFWSSGDKQLGILYLKEALDSFEKRYELLNPVVSQDIPSRADFMKKIAHQLDMDVTLLGIPNIQAIRDLAEEKIRKHRD